MYDRGGGFSNWQLSADIDPVLMYRLRDEPVPKVSAAAGFVEFLMVNRTEVNFKRFNA